LRAFQQNFRFVTIKKTFSTNKKSFVAVNGIFFLFREVVLIKMMNAPLLSRQECFIREIVNERGWKKFVFFFG
jgi:uncharacterized membrane protein YesL